MDYSKIAYAKVNLTYDKELFIKEYDEHILPDSIPIMNGFWLNKTLSKLNTLWGMIPQDLYENAYCWIFSKETNKFEKLTENRIPSWQMAQLMYVDAETIDDDLRRVSGNGYKGGTTLRNMAHNKEWKIKPEFKDLNIVKYMQGLPLKRIISMHCVSLESGQFATIHRDSKSINTGTSNPKNYMAKLGYIVLTFNISDGGVPLYWALDGEESKIPYKVNDDVYITNDYFLHGVPVTTSRRRQIRVTGIPDENFESLIDKNTMITIPDDYDYNDIWGIDNR